MVRCGSRRSALAAVLVVSLFLGGCQYMEDNPSMATGAAVGAVAGAVGGGLYKGSKGAAWGALAGALAGGLVGAYLDNKDQEAEETYDEYGYDPADGLRLEVVKVATEPEKLLAGQNVELVVTYALMAPDPQSVFRVTERRLVTLNGETVANTERKQDRTSGTYSSRQKLQLPDNAKPGAYVVEISVSTGPESAAGVSTFTVQ
jgi:hypothetical protein